MRDLDLIEIRRNPRFFYWHIDPFDCSYHIEKSDVLLRIYVEYNITCDAQFLYLYKLSGDPSGFTLKFFTKRDKYTTFVGNKKEEVIEAVIDKIIRGTTMGPIWVELELALVGENLQKKEECEERIKMHLEQKEKLTKILLEKLNEFIK